MAVVDDEAVLGYLASLPSPKRQPNLLFAEARYLPDAVLDMADLDHLVVEQHDRLVEVMLERRTQTNKPSRSRGSPWGCVSRSLIRHHFRPRSPVRARLFASAD